MSAHNQEPIGVGIVGLGGFGQFCLEAFAHTPGIVVAAVADADPERVRAAVEARGVRGYPDLSAMLKDGAVQIVHLCTPPYLHAAQGLAVLGAGRHLFCEKPLALTVEDGAKLIEAAAANRLRLSVNYVMRQNPFWQAAARVIQSGALGALRHMSLVNHANGKGLAADHWFWDKARSGGIWIEHGVHFFDAFTWLAGKPGEILSAASYLRADGATDRVEALLRFGHIAAHCYHAFDQSGATEQTTAYLTLEGGYLTLREWLPTAIEVLTEVPPSAWEPFLPGTVRHAERTGSMFRAEAYAPEGKAALYRANIQAGIRDLAEAVRDPQHTLAVQGTYGLESLRLAVDAERKARTIG